MQCMFTCIRVECSPTDVVGAAATYNMFFKQIVSVYACMNVCVCTIINKNVESPKSHIGDRICT